MWCGGGGGAGQESQGELKKLVYITRGNKADGNGAGGRVVWR